MALLLGTALAQQRVSLTKPLSRRLVVSRSIQRRKGKYPLVIASSPLDKSKFHESSNGSGSISPTSKASGKGDYDTSLSYVKEDYPTGLNAQGETNSIKSRAGMGNGVFLMLMVNFALHTVAYFWNPTWVHSLALSHSSPKIWQFVTAAFVHANWDHLFGNAFSLLVFGRMVEEEEGALGLWVTYIICGISGNIASYLSSPGSATISLGASSAVFGLFMVGVLTKLRPSVKQLLEAAILGSYVVKQVLQEVQMVASGASIVAGQMTVGHMAHLGGAAGGVLLVILLSRLPPVP
ncbi:Rhomboid-like protein 11 [Picochlorum sp. SENEW3]|nr:Rhomboid-like protein 11 [Picochlorum sp. SENEW3]